MADFILCVTCQHFRAVRGGHTTPSGKPVCNSCYDKYKASQTEQHRASVRHRSKVLKTKPDRYADSFLKAGKTD